MSTISGSSFAASVSGLSPSGLSAAAMLPVAAPSGRSQKAAREFEAQLIGMVLESLEKTFAAVPGQEPMAGEDNYNYMGTRALASAVADGGGFGIARMITQHLGETKGAPGGVPQPLPMPGARR